MVVVKLTTGEDDKEAVVQLSYTVYRVIDKMVMDTKKGRLINYSGSHKSKCPEFT